MESWIGEAAELMDEPLSAETRRALEETMRAARRWLEHVAGGRGGG